MSPLERIEDQYPQLHFYMIDVPSPHYHGHIVGNDVYINENQPELDWLLTALHETVHYRYDDCDLSNRRKLKTMKAEGWAVHKSGKEFNKLLREAHEKQ